MNTNAIAADEMERKKERILMASLRRQQKIEEARERKEAEAQARKELELRKEEERLKRKEDQALKRAQILEQHKLKKAMEDDEKEVSFSNLRHNYFKKGLQNHGYILILKQFDRSSIS